MLKVRESERIGRARYVVTWHTNKVHADGSEFWDIAIFKNKKKKDKFVKELWKNAQAHD